METAEFGTKKLVRVVQFECRWKYILDGVQRHS